jgi:hypothetical protein
MYLNAKRRNVVDSLATTHFPVELVTSLLLCVFFAIPAAVVAQESRLPTAEKPYVVEYYYKARWGYADEFIRLFKKNHFPVLKKQIDMGRILKVSAVKPRLHGTEEGRWDYRVTIVFKNVQMTVDGFDEAALMKTLCPDQETFKTEEQRRFEILLAHWDLPIDDVGLEQ